MSRKAPGNGDLPRAAIPSGGGGAAATGAGSGGGDDDRADGDLAALVAEGDREAAAVLINRHQPMVRSFLRRLTGRHDLADDIAQETFVRMLENAHRFDPKYAMRTWLFTIARRLVINYARKAERRVMSTEFEGMSTKDDGPSTRIEAEDENRALRDQLQEALGQLTESQRAALVLVHQQGMSVEDAAKALDMPVGTVKSHLHRGRNAMRKILLPEREVMAS